MLSRKLQNKINFLFEIIKKMNLRIYEKLYLVILYVIRSIQLTPTWKYVLYFELHIYNFRFSF